MPIFIAGVSFLSDVWGQGKSSLKSYLVLLKANFLRLWACYRDRRACRGLINSVVEVFKFMFE